MAEKMPRKPRSTVTGASSKPKKRGIFSSTSKGDNLPATTQLMFPKGIQLQSPNSRNLHFKTEDKLSILFRHKNYCVVQRKYDRTVAVLKNAVFKQRNPAIMFDVANFPKLEAALSNNIRISLMYTVAKTSYSDPRGISFEKDDVIFILAACRKELLGITLNYKVGFFPSDLVLAITKRRLCFFEGMMLDVTAIANYEAKSPKEFSVRRGQDYEISKGKKGLFDWYASNDLKVPLNFVAEKGTDVPAMTEDEGIYDTISEIKDDCESPNANYQEYMSETYQSTTGVIDSWRNPQEGSKDIEKQFRERLALENAIQASNGPPRLPPIRTNSVYMDLVASSDHGSVIAPCSDISDENYHTVDFGTVTVDQERTLCKRVPDSWGSSHAISEQAENETKISDENYHTVDFGTVTVDQERTLYKRIPDSRGSLHAVSEQAENETKHKPNYKMQDLLTKLANYRDVMMNDQLRCIVSEYVDEDVWDQLGRRIKVPKNKRREIANKEESIYAKTNELLGAWCERFESKATIGFLIDALVEVNPEDLELILEDVCKALLDNNVACGVYETRIS